MTEITDPRTKLDTALAELEAAIARARVAAAALREGAPDLVADIAADGMAVARIAAEETRRAPIPPEVLKRTWAGENPIKVFREWHGLGQVDLAEAVDMSQGYLSEMEAGRKVATAYIYKRLAGALGVPGELLVETEEMPVWRLVPQHLENADWSTSARTAPAVIRAPSSRAARAVAGLAFARAIRPRRGPTLVNPWRQDHLVKVTEIHGEDRYPNLGPVDILNPPHHDHWLDPRIDWPAED